MIGARVDVWRSDFGFRRFRASRGLQSFGTIGLKVEGAPKRVEQGYFSLLSFLRRHTRAHGRLRRLPAFWNLAVSDMFSRSADFGRNRAYGVGKAGAPNRVKQGFCCTESAKSAPSLQSLHQVCKVCTKSAKSAMTLHLAHFMHTI